MEDNEEAVLEDKSAGIVLTRAILHILDSSTDTEILSQQTLDLEKPEIQKYVYGHTRRCFNDLRSRHGTFLPDSPFQVLMHDFFHQRKDFEETSGDAAGVLSAWLKEHPGACLDVLAVDFRADEVPYFGIMLLMNQSAWTHTTQMNGDRVANSFAHQPILPSATRKLSSFCFVNLLNDEILYTDETNWPDDTALLQDVLLHCTGKKSDQEVISQMTQIANEVAQQYDENPSIAVSGIKRAVRTSAKEERPLAMEEAVEEAFAGYDHQEEMAAAFEQKRKEAEVPDALEVPKAAVVRKMKNQKLKTDTGIELSFPVEYFQNPDLIDFIKHEDGTITIEIKHIGKILNRS